MVSSVIYTFGGIIYVNWDGFYLQCFIKQSIGATNLLAMEETVVGPIPLIRPGLRSALDLLCCFPIDSLGSKTWQSARAAPLSRSTVLYCVPVQVVYSCTDPVVKTVTLQNR